MTSNLFKNPEIIRNFRSKLRLKTALVTFVIIVAIILFVGILALAPSERHPSELKQIKIWHTLFMLYASFAMLIGYFYGAMSTATSIVSEKEKKTYDFLFLTPLSDTTLTMGKLLGATSHAWFIVLIIFPFILITGLLGQVNAVRLILFCLVLISGTLFFSALGLLVSAGVNKSAQASGGALGLVVIIVWLSCAFLVMDSIRFLSILSPVPMMREIGEEIRTATYYRSNPYINDVSFFGLGLNGAWFSLLGYCYLTGWAIIAVTRKIRNPAGTYLSKPQAIIFFLVFEVFMVGAIWKYSRLPVSLESHYTYFDFLRVLYAYTFTHILLLLAFSLGLTLSHEDYFAYMRTKTEKRPYKLFHQRTPAHLLFVIFFIIMLGGFILALRSFDLPKSVVLHLVVAVETAAVFYLLMQLFKALIKNYGAVVAVILFIVGNTIPPLTIAVIDLPLKYYLYFSPVAYLTQLGDAYVFQSNTEFYTLPVLLAILLVVIGVLFIRRHATIKGIVSRRAQA